MLASRFSTVILRWSDKRCFHIQQPGLWQLKQALFRMSVKRCFERLERLNYVLSICIGCGPSFDTSLDVRSKETLSNAALTRMVIFVATLHFMQFAFRTSNWILFCKPLTNFSHFSLLLILGILSTILRNLDRYSAIEPFCLQDLSESRARRSWCSGTDSCLISATNSSHVFGASLHLSKVYHYVAAVPVNNVVAKEIRLRSVRTTLAFATCNNLKYCFTSYNHVLTTKKSLCYWKALACWV